MNKKIIKNWEEILEKDGIEYEQYIKDYNELNKYLGLKDIENPIQKIILNKNELKKTYDIFSKDETLFKSNRRPFKEQHKEIKRIVEKGNNIDYEDNIEQEIEKIFGTGESSSALEREKYETIGIYTID